MGSAKIYGLIGNPITHSLSPAMHNAAFAALHLNAQYKLFPLQENELKPFLESLDQRSICGLNVTFPYKEKVISFLTEFSEEASLIGAVNTIKPENNGLTGFNTDGEGFIRHLREDLGFYPHGKAIAIIGAGGASKALSVYVSRCNPAVIRIYDIDAVKLSSMIAHLKRHFPAIQYEGAPSPEGLDIKNADLLINATPMGMKESDPCPVEEKRLHANLLVYDLIYKPLETKLLQAARRCGAKTSNGLGMLLYQGMIAFEIWTGKIAPKEIMEQALQSMLTQNGL